VSLIYQSRVGPFKEIHSSKRRLVVISFRAYWSTLVDWFYSFDDLSIETS